VALGIGVANWQANCSALGTAGRAVAMDNQPDGAG